MECWSAYPRFELVEQVVEEIQVLCEAGFGSMCICSRIKKDENRGYKMSR